jgi:hypothetical protein
MQDLEYVDKEAIKQMYIYRLKVIDEESRMADEVKKDHQEELANPNRLAAKLERIKAKKKQI